MLREERGDRGEKPAERRGVEVVGGKRGMKQDAQD